MPLFDFHCRFCGATFEAVTPSDRRVAPCPGCLTPAGLDSPTPTASELEVEAKKLGVIVGRQTRDGDDLEQYAREHGSDAASTLLADIWSPSFAPLQQLQALARARGIDFDEDAVWRGFSEGFLAACGDVYDDSAKR